MKTTTSIYFLCAALAVAQGDPSADPTEAGATLEAILRGPAAGLPPMQVKGLVFGGGREDGLVFIEGPEKQTVLARTGKSFSLNAGGAARSFRIPLPDENGLRVESAGTNESATLAGYSEAWNGRAAEGVLSYVEFNGLPLVDALRMLGAQSRRNFSASLEAGRIPVNVMLQTVAADNVVEEICKSHNLWFKKDEQSGITRIMTVGEFEKDLAGFREEETVVFTLKYPNVAEVAKGIADLYGDRVSWSLEADETDEEMRRDLENRFDRFEMLNRRTMESTTTVMGNGGSTTVFGEGTYGARGGFGYGDSRMSGSGFGDSSGSWRNRQNRIPNQANDPVAERERQEFRDLTPALVERIENALDSPDAANASALEDLRKREAAIHVTASRRNNMVVVRTSDSRALKEIRDLVTRMDVPTPLVLLEVQVVNIQLGRDFRSAFDYQFSDGANAAAFARGAIPPNPDGGALPAIGFNSTDMTFVVVNDNFRARMQLFEEKNRVHTLASPVLLTANNEVSRLFLGEERPIVRNVSSQTILTNENVATTPNTEVVYRPVGNTLLITPNINSDRTVTLRLVQENSFIKPDDATIPVITNGVGSSTNVSEIKVDVVATRSISGTFVAKDGMAVAAGGLIESGIGTNRGQVPVLGSIPGVGLLFRRQEDTRSRNELVVMIRPHVLSTPADGERISRDMLRQLAPGAVQKLLDEGILPEGPDLQDLPLPPDPIGEILPDARPLFSPELKREKAPRPSAPAASPRNPHQGLLKK